jgi:hypothetical protein
MDIADNEVILEGVVYNLCEFSKVHPGGSNILNIFGGKDATIHYYMLHPHNKIRTNILDKYKTIDGGTAKNADILGYQVYILNSSIFNELKENIKKAVPYQYATYEWWIKAYAII